MSGGVRPTVWPVQLQGWLFDEGRFVELETRAGSVETVDLGRLAAELAAQASHESTLDDMLLVASDGVAFRFFRPQDEDRACSKLLGDLIRMEGTVDRWGRLAPRSCEAAASP